MEVDDNLKLSFLRIRKVIGILGILLPITLFLFENQALSSISHYYYSRSAVFFIAILFSFGTLLISYKGYKRDPATEWISDNVITNIAGIGILLVVFIPTGCCGSGSLVIDQLCKEGIYQLYGHENQTKNVIHLASAGIFIFSIGYMSIFRFTKGDKKEHELENKIYRVCGYTIWACLLILLIRLIFSLQFTDIDVFIFETIAVVAFGISWLVKGETLVEVKKLTNEIFE